MFDDNKYFIQNGQIFEKLVTGIVRHLNSAAETYELVDSLRPNNFRIFLEIKNIEFEIIDDLDPNKPRLKAFIQVEGRKIELPGISKLPEYYCDEEFWVPVSKSSSADALDLFGQVGLADVGMLDVSQAMFLAVQGRRLIPKLRVMWDESLIDQPPKLENSNLLFGHPYEYQQVGYEWLVWLRKMGIGGLLGDEMGLGKTLQLIMLLMSEVSQNRVPNLIVCPPSLLENWRRELVKFAGIDPYFHQGKFRNLDHNFISAQPVVLISYDTLKTDQHYLDEIQWNLVGVDEAQYIKNPSSQRTLAVKSLKKKCGVAISGTPIENRIEDLWSLMDFTCKGLLGELRWFEQNFSDDPLALSELRKSIKPTLLRRRVCEVAKDLPELTKKIVYLNMPKRLYENYLALSSNPSPDRQEATSRFMKKRKICNHVVGINSEFISDEDDGKIQYLKDSFNSLSSNGQKGIVFVPFTSALLGLENWFKSEFKSFFVDHIFGGTPIEDRQKIIDRFSEFKGGGVLLLNPKAGGVGLNITAANHVFHYSPDWNPAVMDQASARSFRRGQDLPVTIHNMRYEGTVEVDMYERLDRKRQLSEDALIDSDLIPTLEELNVALARIPNRYS